jgi:hypothetical protein
MLNYISIIIYKMASLLALMNRTVSYFKSETNSEVSTDDESNDVDCGSSVDGMSIDDNEIIPYEDTPKQPCYICKCLVHIDEYNYERQKCNACCLLTEEDEKQCGNVRNSGISHYMNILQILDASNV